MLRQGFQQKLLQKLSPQQIQLMKMLQLPLIALEQRIKEEMEINPALEEGAPEETKEDTEFEDSIDSNEDSGTDIENQREDFNLDQYIDDDEIPSYKLAANNTSADDERKEIPYAGGTTFHEQLSAQLGLRNLTDSQEVIAQYILGNIDDDGYLRREISAMVDDLAFTQNIIATEDELESLLKVIQDLDPPGVGARSLQECLLIQLNRSKRQNIDIRLAKKIVGTMMEEFTKKHYDKIAKRLDISEEELKDAIDEIVKLNPKPGNSMSDNQGGAVQITPDFFLYNNDGELELTMNGRNAPELRVSREYADMLTTYAKGKDRSQKDAAMFVKQKLESAKWFIDAIQQRNNTLLYTMNAILKFQYEYFIDGDETKLKPMILKDIAEIVSLDISTISRVVNSKYIQTSFGTFLLKTFFSESLSTDSGEEVSTREVKKILQNTVEAENKSKPVTDDELAALLHEKGYNIARRTVAKYREQLNIPVARLRKQL